MKTRILVLLLLAFSSVTIAQTTLANKLKITGNSTSTTATKVNVQEDDGTVNTKPLSDFGTVTSVTGTDGISVANGTTTPVIGISTISQLKVAGLVTDLGLKLDKGSFIGTADKLVDVIEVVNFLALPITGVAGKIYVTNDDNKIYRWNGTIYVELSVTDISGKEDKTNKQNDLTADVTNLKYPTVTAVNDGFINSINSSIYAWGDSLTFGTGSTTGNDYPSILSTLVNWKVYNKGIPGETSTQIKDRFVSFYTANSIELKKPIIIWAGRNNYPDATTIKADIATMIAMLPHKNYLVLGITNSNPGEPIGNSGYTQIVTLNNDLSILYQGRFLDVRKWLVANYNQLLPQDVIDFGLDVPPTSLLSDNIHLNNKGYRLVNDLIVKSFAYLSNSSNASFNSLNARVLFLPNTVNSILKTGVNGQVSNAAIYENSFNLGLGFLPNAISDTQNFEFINGGTIASRVAVPQFSISSNAYGTFYASKYKTSNFSSQILLNGNAGTFEISTAPSGIINESIIYTNRFYVANDGKIGIGTTSPNAKLDVNGTFNATGAATFSSSVTAANGTALTHLITKGQTLYNNLSITANRTVTIADFVNTNELIIFADATAGNLTVALPSASLLSGYSVTIKLTASTANSVTITGNANIDGASTLVLSGQYSKSKITSNGTQYFIL
jgi:lysophospholipase L1-like esterase